MSDDVMPAKFCPEHLGRIRSWCGECYIDELEAKIAALEAENAKGDAAYLELREKADLLEAEIARLRAVAKSLVRMIESKVDLAKAELTDLVLMAKEDLNEALALLAKEASSDE